MSHSLMHYTPLNSVQAKIWQLIVLISQTACDLKYKESINKKQVHQSAVRLTAHRFNSYTGPGASHRISKCWHIEWMSLKKLLVHLNKISPTVFTYTHFHPWKSMPPSWLGGRERGRAQLCLISLSGVDTEKHRFSQMES